MIADWTRYLPNAWFFNDTDTPYIVVSGGLMRLATLDQAGLAFVLAHHIAQARGHGCTGEADYRGCSLYLRSVYYDEAYFAVFEQGLAQLEATFALVSPEHAKENPNNICAQPSLECRVTAMKNGGAFRGVPACAKSSPDLAVTGASAPSLEQVVVEFSAPVFAPTATMPVNYEIEGTGVLQVAMETDSSVAVTVDGLSPSTGYTVTATDVISNSGRGLNPDARSADFETR